MKTIGFIGIGNMGGAMAKACAALNKGCVWIFDLNKSLYDAFGSYQTVRCAENIKEIMEVCDYVIMSIKPQYYQDVAKEIKAFVKEEQVIITVAPSFSLGDMEQLLGQQTKLIRTMPNTPALIGEGITAYCYNSRIKDEEELADFIQYFKSFGELVKIDEKLMPAVVATTGSSPAYAYLFIEAMADAAVSFGMPRNMAYQMAAMAIKGSAEMILRTGKHPGELKDAVTSPGGTTIKAVLAMEENGFRNSVIKGMEACYKQVSDMAQSK